MEKVCEKNKLQEIIRYSSKIVKLEANGGKKTRTPHKNTMVTLTDEKSDVIYFGIARVMRTPDGKYLDCFKKRVGRTTACNRAILACEEEMQPTNIGMNIHDNGHYGVVKEKDIQQLLDYFDNIDIILFQKRISLNRAKNK